MLDSDSTRAVILYYAEDDNSTIRVRGTVDLASVSLAYAHPNPIEPGISCFTITTGGQEVMVVGRFEEFKKDWEDFKKRNNPFVQFFKN